jgi:hypothetical protein
MKNLLSHRLSVTDPDKELLPSVKIQLSQLQSSPVNKLNDLVEFSINGGDINVATVTCCVMQKISFSFRKVTILVGALTGPTNNKRYSYVSERA